jgi:hypothetical protein
LYVFFFRVKINHTNPGSWELYITSIARYELEINKISRLREEAIYLREAHATKHIRKIKETKLLQIIVLFRLLGQACVTQTFNT